MRKSIRMTRAGRRVFAKKSGPTYGSIRHDFIMRGGGYL